MPDRRAVVVPEAVASALVVAQDRQVGLRGAESLAVKHRLRQALRGFHPTPQAVEPVDQVIVQEELGSDTQVQRTWRRRRQEGGTRSEPQSRGRSGADLENITPSHGWTSRNR